MGLIPKVDTSLIPRLDSSLIPRLDSSPYWLIHSMIHVHNTCIHTSIESSVQIFSSLYLLRCGFLGSSCYPQPPSVRSIPRPTFGSGCHGSGSSNANYVTKGLAIVLPSR